MNAGRISSVTTAVSEAANAVRWDSLQPASSGSAAIGSSSGQVSTGESRSYSITATVRRTGETLATRPSARLPRSVDSCSRE